MTDAVDSMTNIDSNLMKRVSRMHEAGLPIKEIAQQLGIQENTVKRVLQLLGYALTD
jgi:orotate phosphoribosyltransferase-like protein